MNFKRKVFTIVELLVVVSIMIILISILLPGLSKSKLCAQKIVCAGNLKQIGTYIQLYVDSADSWLPYSTSPDPESWHIYMAKYDMLGNITYNQINATEWPIKFLKCPNETSLTTVGGGSFMRTNYGLNLYIRSYVKDEAKVSLCSTPSQRIVIGESGGSTSNGTIMCPYITYLPKLRHLGAWNMVFLDGHVGNMKTIPATRVPIWRNTE